MNIQETNLEAQQSSKHPIAALYQRFVLDPMVEVARVTSHDFVRRPRHYRAVPENVADILDGFRIRTGSSPEWLSVTQRSDLFAPIFGDAFDTINTDLRYAAVAFAESNTERNLDALEDSVRNAAIASRGYLKSIEGRAVSQADIKTSLVFQSAIEVLRNKAVAGAFGLPPAPGGNWPLDGALNVDDASTDGAFLIEEIQRASGLSPFRPILTQHQFILLQRVAYYGALTIAGVLGDAASWNRADSIHALVRNAYGWEKALQSLLSEIDYTDKNLQPRVVSQIALDDDDLKSLPTEEEAKSYGVQLQQAPGDGKPNTCTFGWTRICDNPKPGQSCKTGWTFYCETGPTCTSGYTIKCDKWFA